MFVVELESTDPQFNLATEEYFLKHTDGDYFILWRNAPSVIIGKNQNAYAEINRDFVAENNISVVRRLTGGGAVFHDLGNINYTFIESDASDKFGNYEVFSAPILETLHKLGINAQLKGRNDLVIDDKKFSGNAQTLYHGRMMHHGTLLFSSDFSHLTNALNVNPLKVQSKGIKSVRSRVTNINEYLTDNIDVLEFARLIKKSALENEDNILYTLSDYDLAEITKLYKEKYSTDSWNYGFNKEFSVKNEKLLPGGIVNINLELEEGKIKNAVIYGDFFGISDVAEFEKMLVGLEYIPEKVEEFLKTVNISDYFSGISASDILTVLF